MTDQTCAEVADNETRRFIADALAAAQRNVPLRVNPAFDSLQAVLIDGVPGEVAVAFTAGDTTVQGNGVVGGGTLANMLDSAIAVAVLSALKPGGTCSTVSLTVNMLRSGKAGDFVARAGVDKLGGRVAFAHAQLYDANHVLVANATASLAVMTMQSDQHRSNGDKRS